MKDGFGGGGEGRELVLRKQESGRFEFQGIRSVKEKPDKVEIPENHKHLDFS